MKRLIIRYKHNLGGHPLDRRLREGIFDGEDEVYDWNSKKNLIDDAIRNGRNREVQKLCSKTKWYVTVKSGSPIKG